MRANRLNDIEQYIIEHGTVSMEELVNQFQISINTVRRDINELLDRKHIKKVYGGVAINDEPLLPVSIRENRNNLAKTTIGRLAASLVQDGDTIFLDAGSTTPHILPYLSERKGITVITHSLIAMSRASEVPGINLIALGGMYNPHTSAFASIATAEDLAKFHITTTFLATTCVSLETGLSSTTYLDAEIKRRIASQAERVILMVDRSKFDQSAVISFYQFADLDGLVVDSRPPEPYLVKARECGIQVLYE